MVRPWKIDKNVSRAFTVIRHLDLNSLPPHIHFVSSILFNQIQFSTFVHQNTRQYLTSMVLVALQLDVTCKQTSARRQNVQIVLFIRRFLLLGCQVTYVGEAASESECFCFGYAGSVEAHFKLTKRAYVPGDYITFDSEITNNAGFSIENACAKLMAVSKIIQVTKFKK